MQGSKVFQDELFTMVNLEKLIPKNHLLRKIDKILDLSFVRDMTKNLYSDKIGRPSIDPEVFVRMMLIAHFYGITSDRQLCEELRYNFAYRWYCKFSLSEETPDHSSMTKIRDRLGETVIKNIFLKVVGLCKEHGLVKSDAVIVDASLIKADAALNSLVENEATEEEIKNRPNIIPRGSRYTNKTHKSCSDPGSTLASKTGVPKGLYYKTHNIIDSESRVILDAHATTGAVSDGKVLVGRLDNLEENHKCSYSEVTADRGYGFGENLQALEEKKKKTNIPLYAKRIGDQHEGFEYEAEADRFRCLAGNYLYPTKTRDKEAIRYRTLNRECVGCSYENNCKVIDKLLSLYNTNDEYQQNF